MLRYNPASSVVTILGIDLGQHTNNTAYWGLIRQGFVLTEPLLRVTLQYAYLPGRNVPPISPLSFLPLTFIFRINTCSYPK